MAGAGFVVRALASMRLLTLPVCSPAASQTKLDSWWRCMMAEVQALQAAAATRANGRVMEAARVSWWARWPQEYLPTPALRSTTPTTKTRGCYIVAAQTGNGRWPSKQCTRHHRSDHETNTASKVVAARTGNGRIQTEPPPPPRNHQQPETPTFLPLPARQSAFLAYFLFGQKKVGRSGGAKAFDFKPLTLKLKPLTLKLKPLTLKLSL